MSASSLVAAAEAAVDKAQAARSAAKEAMTAARKAELLAREALEAAKRTLQLERRAEEERARRPISELSLSSVSSASPGLLGDIGEKDCTYNLFNRSGQGSSDLLGSRDNSNDPSHQSHQSETFSNSSSKAENHKNKRQKIDSDGLNMLLKKFNRINMLHHEEKPLNPDQSKNGCVHIPEVDDFDDNQNCRGFRTETKFPNRRSVVSQVSDSDGLINVISVSGTSKDKSQRKVSNTVCDNCRLSGMCLHSRYLERLMPKTEGMRVRAVGAVWDTHHLGRVGQVAGGGPGGRVKIRWAWQSGVGGEAWRRLETYSLSWGGEFSFQFWCRDPEQGRQQTQLAE